MSTADIIVLESSGTGGKLVEYNRFKPNTRSTSRSTTSINIWCSNNGRIDGQMVMNRIDLLICKYFNLTDDHIVINLS